MKLVILAGGLGTRLAEETEVKPKPMVEIGGRPILWHIMKHYSYYGFTEFYVALGYKGEIIKRYFMDYALINTSMTVHLSRGKVDMHEGSDENWTIHLMETGLQTMTGGRLKRLENWLNGETFLLTYGDGVCNLDLHHLVQFHRDNGCLATITAVRPPSRFGGLIFEGNLVSEFTEKPQIGEGWINGGFMVLEPGVFRYLRGDQDVLEVDLLERLSEEKQLAAYRHDEFWQCMDTLRDKRLLERLWQENAAPWKIWQ
jgi:glucose-1-phosphate cytidylyltransferase